MQKKNINTINKQTHNNSNSDNVAVEWVDSCYFKKIQVTDLWKNNNIKQKHNNNNSDNVTVERYGWENIFDSPLFPGPWKR